MATHGGGGAAGGGRPPWCRVRFKHLLIAAGTAYFCFMYLFHSNLQSERPFADADRQGIIGEEAFLDDRSRRRNVRNAGRDDAARQELFDSIRLPQVGGAASNLSGDTVVLQDVSSPVAVAAAKSSKKRRTPRPSTKDLDPESLRMRVEILKLARHRRSSYNLNIPPRCLASPTFDLRSTSRLSSRSKATRSNASSVVRRSSDKSANPSDSPGKNSTAETSAEELRRRYNARLPFAAPLDVFAEDDFRFQELSPLVLVYSAYLDDRPNDFDNRHNGSLVRMMFIMKTKSSQTPPLYCVFKSDGDGDGDGPRGGGPTGRGEGTTGRVEEGGNLLYVSKVSQYYEMCENHNKQLGGFILSCHVPIELEHPPCYVTLYTTDPSVKDFDITDAEGVRVPIRSLTQHFSAPPAVGSEGKTADEPVRKFTVCVPPLFGMVNSSRLVEFVEFATSMGFEKIVLYAYQIRDDILEILKYYTSGRPVIEVVPWDLPKDIDKIIWYHAQLVAIQDCLYRNMALSSYVAFMDIDELLVPRQFNSWSSQIKTIDREDRCGFQFVGAYFDPFATPTLPRTNIATEVKQSTKVIRRDSVLDNVYALNSFKRTQMFDRVRTKCMVKPKLIFEKGIHHISKPIWSHLKVDQVDPVHAVLHHYKTCSTHGRFSDCSSYVRDESVLKFAGRAVRSLVQTHNKLSQSRLSVSDGARSRIVVL